MSEPVKKCMWCRFCDSYTNSIFMRGEGLERYLCRHPNRGESMITFQKNFRGCQSAREDVNDCGPTAKWFEEQKPAPPYVSPPKKRWWQWL